MLDGRQTRATLVGAHVGVALLAVIGRLSLASSSASRDVTGTTLDVTGVSDQLELHSFVVVVIA